MITYAQAVIWVWTVALVATLVALAIAWRAVARADAAVSSLRVATDGVGALEPASAALADEVGASRARRARSVERAQVIGD